MVGCVVGGNISSKIHRSAEPGPWQQKTNKQKKPQKTTRDFVELFHPLYLLTYYVSSYFRCSIL